MNQPAFRHLGLTVKPRWWIALQHCIFGVAHVSSHGREGGKPVQSGSKRELAAGMARSVSYQPNVPMNLAARLPSVAGPYRLMQPGSMAVIDVGAEGRLCPLSL